MRVTSGGAAGTFNTKIVCSNLLVLLMDDKITVEYDASLTVEADGERKKDEAYHSEVVARKVK
jgi:hypothetical protein